MVSRHRELSVDSRNCFDIRTEEKFVAARHRNQHARRMRYPDHDVPRGVSFWPSFVSRTSHPRAEIRSRNSSLWFHFFSRLAFSRSFASCATSSGGRISFSVSRSRTLFMRFHQSNQAFAEAASSSFRSIARFVSRIVSNKKPSAAEMFRSFFFQAEDGIRDLYVTGVQTCALPI